MLQKEMMQTEVGFTNTWVHERGGNRFSALYTPDHNWSIEFLSGHRPHEACQVRVKGLEI